MEVLHEIKQDVAAFKGSTNAVVTELVDFKKRSESLITDGERFKTEFTYLKSLTKWAVATAITLILLLGGVAANVVSMRAENANTSKSLDAFRRDSRQDLGGLREDTRKEYGELHKAVEAMNRVIDRLQVSLDTFNKKFTEQETKIDKIHAIVNDVEKSKGESYSEFMTQRSLLTKDELKERVDRKSPLLFEVKPPYDTLSPARSSRPSAVLANPRNPLLDTVGFQIKAKKADDGIIHINIAGSESTLDIIEDFLKKAGSIPIDLTIRTPIDR